MVNFAVMVVDFADRTNTKEFGNDIAGAVGYAKQESIFGNTDYTVLVSGGIPVAKYVDGEEVKL